MHKVTLSNSARDVYGPMILEFSKTVFEKLLKKFFLIKYLKLVW